MSGYYDCTERCCLNRVVVEGALEAIDVWVFMSRKKALCSVLHCVSHFKLLSSPRHAFCPVRTFFKSSVICGHCRWHS